MEVAVLSVLQCASLLYAVKYSFLHACCSKYCDMKNKLAYQESKEGWMYFHIAPDKAPVFRCKVLIFFLFLHENICCSTH